MSGLRYLVLSSGGFLRWPFAVLCCVIVFSLAQMCLCADSSMAEEGRGIVDPHNYLVRKNCVLCHTSKPPELSFDPVTTCTKCHSTNVGDHPVVRHPIGLAPKTDVPKFMPLSPDGRLVCYTCHDPHNKSPNPKMLRVAYLKLCSACHPGY